MLEAEQSVVNNELDGRKPFVIRGHHLPYFVSLVRKVGNEVMTPQERAKDIRVKIKALTDFSPSKSIEAAFDMFHMLNYTDDVIGNTDESADRYERFLKEVFESFLSLPDDYPAELAENKKDAMCEACTVGNHCSQNTNSVSPGEKEPINEFLEKVSLLNLPKPEIVSIVQGPNQLRRVKTTLGTIREVLKEVDIEKI